MRDGWTVLAYCLFSALGFYLTPKLASWLRRHARS